MNMTPIETQEIKGINLRNLIALILATVSIVSTTVVSYSSLKTEIRELKLQDAGDTKYNDLRIQTIEIRISALENEQRELKRRQDGILKRESGQ